MANSNPKPPNAGKGRPKGASNKTTRILKEAILLAAETVGRDGHGGGKLTGYCESLARDEPRAFATLLGRVLPTQLEGEGANVTVIIRSCLGDEE